MKDWIAGIDYPEWMTQEALVTLSKGYLLERETPKDMYKRVAASAAYYIDKPEMESKFFEYMWKSYLCPASPVLSNTGTDRGLNISCFGLSVPDSIIGIYDAAKELAMMTKNGGGVGVCLSNVRGRGELIRGGKNGRSEGVVPWAKIYDSSIVGTAQGGVRRGAAVVNLDIDHLDIHEFLKIRRPQGDVNRQCMNLNHCIVVGDRFMEEMLTGDKDKRELWIEILKTRLETGEPYLMFKDTVERDNPAGYVANNLKVEMTNLCCLTGATLVATKNGPTPIEDLVGKTTTIWDGRNWIENNSFEFKGIGPIYRVHLTNGEYVDCTANHRWFVARDYNQVRRNQYQEVITSDLKINDMLESHQQECHGNVDLEAAYLKGFLIGDGTASNNVPRLNLHSTKYECAQQLMESCQEIRTDAKLRSDCIITPSFSQEIDNTNIYGGAWGVQVFKKMRGLSARKTTLEPWTTAHKQALPVEFINWSRDSKLQFLAGILDADGSVNKVIQITQKSKQLIQDLMVLFKSFGIIAAIDYPEDGMYRISISSLDSYELLSILPVKRLKYQGGKPNRRLTGWRKVRSIEKISENEKVYCPSVPTTGKFALANGLMTGNSEITLHTDEDHSFICCLSSLNLTNWDEWKDTDVVQTSIYFLNGILNEFIDKAQHIPMMEKAVRSAIKGRAIGLGVLGWHSLLQAEMTPMYSLRSKILNRAIFKHISENADTASRALAAEYGEPEWCKNTGRYNTHLIAVAPTRSNSLIAGGHSPSIEPSISNTFTDRTAKGIFVKRNLYLEKLLETYNKSTYEVWASIVENQGSVQHLDFLSQNEKDVFLTAYEINQLHLIELAAERQKYIDQAQSLNLFFSPDIDPKIFHKVHVEAWKSGVKTLYYCRSDSVLRADVASRTYKDQEDEGCSSCEG